MGATRTAPAASASWSRSRPVPTRCPAALLDVLASPQRRAPRGMPPDDPEPCSLVKTTTGQRRHLDHHGRTRTAPAVSASWSRSRPAPTRCPCWMCRPAPSRRAPPRRLGQPRAFGLAKTAVGDAGTSRSPASADPHRACCDRRPGRDADQRRHAADHCRRLPAASRRAGPRHHRPVPTRCRLLDDACQRPKRRHLDRHWQAPAPRQSRRQAVRDPGHCRPAAAAGCAGRPHSAGHPEMPPDDPEPCSLVKTTTGQRRHLDRHGRTRTASAVSASWSRSWPVSARCRCWMCRPAASTGHPRGATGQPRALRPGEDRHRPPRAPRSPPAPPHRAGRVGDLVEILAGVGPLPLLDAPASPQRRPRGATGQPHPVSLQTVTAAPSAPRPTGAKNAPIPLPCIYVEFPRFQMALASFSGWKRTAM